MSNALLRSMDRFSNSIGAPRRPKWKGRGKPPVLKTRANIVANRWDLRVWEVARGTQAIEDGIRDIFVGDLTGKENRPGYDNAPELVKDLFLALYKAVPRFELKRNVFKDARLNRKILEELLESTEYERLHEMTQLDATLTTMAITSMFDAIKEILQREREQAEDSNNRKRGGEGQPQPGRGPSGCTPGNSGENGESGGEQQPGGGGGRGSGPSKEERQAKADRDREKEKGEDEDDDTKAEGGQDGGDGDGESDEDEDGKGDGSGEDEGDGDSDLDSDEDEDGNPQDDLDDDWDDDEDDDDEGLIDDVDRAWDEALEEEDERELDKQLSQSDIDRVLNRALKGAGDEMNELEQARRGIGLDDGTWQEMSPEKRFEMAERLKSENMRNLADMVGRMKQFAMGQQATKILDVPHEAYDVEQGNDIRRVLKSEFGLLGHEGTKMEFYRRYFDKELLQFKMRGKIEAGKGPIVICIDKSGSMHGRPFDWAMGVAEALRRICQDQDRDYYAMFFGANNDRHRFDFPKGAAPWEKVWEFLSCIANGGTEFDGVLTEALQRCEQASDLNSETGADIVFVTDGQAYLDENWIKEFNDRRAAIGVRLFGVFVGGARDVHSSYYDRITEVLRSVSDQVINVTDLKPESVGDIFAKV